MESDFFVKYHQAVAEAAAAELEKFKSRMGSHFAEDFRKGSPGELKDREQFCRAFGDYLKDDLRFADSVEVSCDDASIILKIRGCEICHGNEALRQAGKSAVCPIIPTGLFSISRAHGRKPTLKGVTKNGVVGDCDIEYRLN